MICGYHLVLFFLHLYSLTLQKRNGVTLPVHSNTKMISINGFFFLMPISVKAIFVHGSCSMVTLSSHRLFVDLSFSLPLALSLCSCLTEIDCLFSPKSRKEGQQIDRLTKRYSLVTLDEILLPCVRVRVCLFGRLYRLLTGVSDIPTGIMLSSAGGKENFGEIFWLAFELPLLKIICININMALHLF
jgi:hypothetical protein